MKPATIAKIVVAIILIGVIVWAIQLGQEQSEQYEQQKQNLAAPDVIAKIAPGSSKIDGQPTELKGVQRQILSDGGGERSKQREWQSVQVAHDGENLHIYIVASYNIGDVIKNNKGTAILGQIQFDADNDLSTGLSGKAQRGYMGIEKQLVLMARRRAASGRTNLICYLEKPESVGETGLKFRKLAGSQRNSADDTGWVAYQGRSIELKIPLADVGIKPHSMARLLFQAMGTSRIPEVVYEVE